MYYEVLAIVLRFCHSQGMSVQKTRNLAEQIAVMMGAEKDGMKEKVIQAFKNFDFWNETESRKEELAIPLQVTKLLLASRNAKSEKLFEYADLMERAAETIKEQTDELWKINAALSKKGMKPWKSASFAHLINVLELPRKEKK